MSRLICLGVLLSGASGFVMPSSLTLKKVNVADRQKNFFGVGGVGVNNDVIQLCYKRFPGNEDEGDLQSSSSSRMKQNKSMYQIPVIGPLLQAPPLLVGSELILDPPTPLQWKTIEECVEIHNRERLKEADNGNKKKTNHATVASTNTPTPATTATVDAAPLVAIMDEHNGTAIVGNNNGERYATLAAIVGITANSKFVLDSSDPASFHSNANMVRSQDSRIRLIGIGRAKLHHFTNEETTFDVVFREQKEIEEEKAAAIKEKEDEEECDAEDGLAQQQQQQQQHQSGMAIQCISQEQMEELIRLHQEQQQQQLLQDASDEEDDTSTIIIDTQSRILMAKMDLLLDGMDSKISPLHAINHMATCANRIAFLHKDRQQLLKGIQAATVRLEMASEEWQDFDGIGELYINKEKEHRATFKAGQQRMGDNKIKGDYNPNASYRDSLNHLLKQFVEKGQSRPLSEKATALLHKENYGMGHTASASFSSLDSMVKALMERMEPYYSPKIMQSEDFEYSIYSFVALASMDLDNGQLSKALQSTDTAERLENAYAWMQEHKELLQEIAQAKTQELRDCGEEVTDLF